MTSHYHCYFGLSLAVDVFDDKLETAKRFGADVIINGKTENLKEAGAVVGATQSSLCIYVHL